MLVIDVVGSHLEYDDVSRPGEREQQQQQPEQQLQQDFPLHCFFSLSTLFPPQHKSRLLKPIFSCR